MPHDVPDGELDEHSQAGNSSEIDVQFSKLKRSNEEFLNEIRSVLSKVPGRSRNGGSSRWGTASTTMLSGTRANIAIKLFRTRPE